MKIRPNTWDAAIVRSITQANEYELPESMHDMVVLDIGAHIGGFAIACKDRNAKRVICYEADPENFQLLRANIAEDTDTDTRITVYNAAVVGKVRNRMGLRRLRNHDGKGGRNTGHVDVFGTSAENEEIPAIGIADAMESTQSDKIDLLKLDCEGAEWIILDHLDLSKVHQLIMEVHAPPVSNHPDVAQLQDKSLVSLVGALITRLHDEGYETSTVIGTEIGKIWAKRQPRHVELNGRPKLLWVGDAGVKTGYGRVTEQICRRLVNFGWDVHVLGIGYNGDPHDFPYKIYPAVDPNTGGAPNGSTRIKGLLNRINPNVVLIQDDHWNVGILADQLGLQNLCYPLVGYIAVDSENVRQDVALQLQQLKHVICHTQFGVDQLKLAGFRGKSSVAGHGVDLDLYAACDKIAAREGLGSKYDWTKAWIWGVVGANQVRKRLDLSVAYFAKWWELADKPENAFIYIHTDANGMWDLRQIADYYGIRKRILTTDGGSTLPETAMPTLYSALDAMISTAGGESWGLTHLEGMACSVPQIAVRCGGMPSWAGDAMLWVDPACYVFSPNRTNTKLYIPGEEQFIAAMQRLYTDRELYQTLTERGKLVAAQCSWDATAAHFDKVLTGVIKINRSVNDTDCLSEFA